MSTSPSLQFDLIEESQNAKEVTANDALLTIEGSTCYQLTVAMADANQTLSDDNANGYAVYKCTGALTAQRNLIVPTRQKKYSVINATSGGFGIQVKTASGTGIVVAASSTGNVYADGTNVVALSGASGSGAVTSVFTRTGAVVATTGDYTAAQVTNAFDTSTTRTANTVYAGPTTGSAAAPTFRALVAADIPSLSYASTAYVDAADAVLEGERGQIVGVNAQSGTTYTLVLADKGKCVECTNASAITLTVPTNASVAFPVGSTIAIAQGGAGQVTISAAGGVTIKKRSSTGKTSAQEAVAQLLKTATDTWRLFGDLEA